VLRGTDVIKALALGANAVAIGRPLLWSLALGGAPALTHTLELLRSEIDTALALCGYDNLELPKELVMF
ncbi:MAG: alpha-hydroxy-acid oxidizing protein, partial [Deinococcales bacterium]